MAIELDITGLTWERLFIPEFVRKLQADTRYSYDLYLSGKMTGKPNFNYARFNYVAHDLRGFNLRIFNPAESFNGVSSLERTYYLRHDVKKVAESGAILMLDDWTDSAGARLEFYIAHELELQIFRINNNGQLFQKA